MILYASHTAAGAGDLVFWFVRADEVIDNSSFSTCSSSRATGTRRHSPRNPGGFVAEGRALAGWFAGTDTVLKAC